VLNVASGEHPGPSVRATIETVLQGDGRRFEILDSGPPGAIALGTFT
jgi:hypothetical protein